MLMSGFGVSTSTASTFPVPIAFYTFDQNTGDTDLIDQTRGNAGKGTLVNGPAFAPGRVGNAICFDGSTEYATAPIVSGVTSEFTISAWVKLDSHTTWGTIVKNWGNANVGAFHLGLDNANQTWSNYLGLQPNSAISVADTSPTLLSQWHHIVTTASQSEGKIRLYVNDVKVDEKAFSGTIASYGSTMSFGVKLDDNQTSPAGVNPGWLDGCLDEVAFWNRALTVSEVSAIYTSAQSGQSPIAPTMTTTTTTTTTTTLAPATSTTSPPQATTTAVATTTTTTVGSATTATTMPEMVALQQDGSLPSAGTTDGFLFAAWVLMVAGFTLVMGVRTQR